MIIYRVTVKDSDGNEEMMVVNDATRALNDADQILQIQAVDWNTVPVIDRHIFSDRLAAYRLKEYGQLRVTLPNHTTITITSQPWEPG